MKIDNSFSASDALRRYGKEALPAVPLSPEDENAPAASRLPAQTGPAMDHVTLSPEAVRLLALGAKPQDAAAAEADLELTYAAPVLPVAES